MKKEYYAHSQSGKPPEDWHRLEDHLKKLRKGRASLRMNSTLASRDIWRGYGMI